MEFLLELYWLDLSIICARIVLILLVAELIVFILKKISKKARKLEFLEVSIAVLSIVVTLFCYTHNIIIKEPNMDIEGYRYLVMVIISTITQLLCIYSHKNRLG